MFQDSGSSPDHFRKKKLPDGQSRFMIGKISGALDRNGLVRVCENPFSVRSGMVFLDDDPVEDSVKKNQ